MNALQIIPPGRLPGKVSGAQYVDLWLNGLSPHTARAYRRDLADFEAFLDDPLRYTDETVILQYGIAYVRKLQDEGKSSATIARRVTGIRSFFDFLCSIGARSRNPLANLRTPKVHNKSREPLTGEDVGAMIAAVERDTVNGKRDHCIMLLLSQLPLRRHEIATLTFGSVAKTADGRTLIRFTGKREQERELPMSRMLLNALDEYRKASGIEAVSDDTPLFRNSEGKRLSDNSIYNIVKKYADAAGIEKEITPHSFRHFNITSAVEVEDSTLRLKQFSGHSSVAMIDRYTHINGLNTVENIQRKRGIV